MRIACQIRRSTQFLSRFLLGTWQAKKRDEHLQEKPPPIGSVHLDEQLLRKLFQKMDRMP